MRKVTILLISLALAIGLCSGFAYAGDALTAGSAADGASVVFTQAKKGYVADRVYALIGNEYAMMVTEKNRVQTINIINSKYDTTFRMSCRQTPNAYGSYNVTPTSVYQYAGLLAHGVKVTAAKTSKVGVVAYAGKKLVSCAYDALNEDTSGAYLVGHATNSKGVGAITVLSGKTGKKIASKSLGKVSYIESVWWSYKHSRISVRRTVESGMYLDVFSFNGKTLKRVSSKRVTSSFVIAPTLVQRGDGVYYTSAKSSGKQIKALAGWSFGGYVTKSTYLFYKSGTKNAKVVDKNAKTLATITAPYNENGWGVVGKYICASTHWDDSKAIQTIFTSAGKKVMQLPKGQRLRSMDVPSSVKYYTSKQVKVKSLGGATPTTIRPVNYYNSKLKVVKGVKPALGEWFHLSMGGKGIYDSGRDAAGNLSAYTGYRQSTPNVVTAAGGAVKCGRYTLSRPVSGLYWPISKSDLRYGSKDAYVAKSSTGKFGLVSYRGKVVLPFSYDDVFCGSSGSITLPKSSKIMVKKNGVWSFSRA